MARGLGLAVALIIASPAVHAAPAKRKKPKHGAAAPASAPAASDDNKDKAEPAPATPPEEPPAAPADTAPKASDEPPPKPEPSAVPEAKVSLDAAVVPPSSAHEEGANDNELEALGRREAARVAAGRTLVAVWISADVGRRSFKYSDPVGDQYAPYRLQLAPVASAGLEAYPFASTNVPGLRDLGFRGRFSKVFAVDSKTPDGVTIDTSWTRFGGEVRERLLFPSAHPFELGISIGADASYFNLSTKTPVPALLPAARTISVRFGLDGRLQIVPRFGVLLGVAYLAPTSRGEIYDRFRSPHLHGLDGDLAFALGIVPGIEARLSGRYTRYFASFKPVPGDAFVAGGALDEQFQFGLGVRYAH